jgi:hypothetical protein
MAWAVRASGPIGIVVERLVEKLEGECNIVIALRFRRAARRAVCIKRFDVKGI